VLKTIASAFMTVSSLTFSLTVVTLQLASSQYSPRLLRTFASDRAVQVTLGVFLGSFAYCLVVLRTVRDSDDSTAEFVPRLSVTLAVLLALVGVVTLVVFLAHLSRKIRIEPILVDVHAEASGVLSRSRPAERVPASLQGRARDLDDLARRQALADFRTWRAAGVEPEHVAVNLSAQSLESPDLVERVLADLAAAGHALAALRKVKSEAKASMRTPILAASLAVPAASLGAVETAVEDVKAAGRVTGTLELVETTEGQGDPAVQGGMVVTSSELGEAPPRTKG
ncbi:DUF2254 family protein, partial [Promicromonospora citrea]|uniref:DUF2254 family protein n=1 Tax=Promicromonospora citrea TaxID=43677 RepID=UPI002016C173